MSEASLLQSAHFRIIFSAHFTRDSINITYCLIIPFAAKGLSHDKSKRFSAASSLTLFTWNSATISGAKEQLYMNLNKIKKKHQVYLYLSSWCFVTVSVLWFFLTMLWVGLLCVIAVFPDHTQFLTQCTVHYAIVVNP